MAPAPDLDLVTIDLDGTLIRDTVFMAAAEGEGLADQFRAWDAQYFAGELTLEECFWLEYNALAGRPAARLRGHLYRAGWVEGIHQAVATLQGAGLEVAVLTDQPSFLVEHLHAAGFDHYLCSDAHVEGGVVTARCDARFDKWQHLEAHLDAAGVPPARVAHVGNGSNDVPVFERVGVAVAASPDSDAVAAAADHVIDPLEDLRQVAELLLKG